MSADLMNPHAVDDETLAAFADGSLDRKESAAVRAHLLDCALCRDTLDIIAGAQAEEIIPRQAKVVRIDWFRYAVPSLAAAAAVAAIFFLPPVRESIDNYRTAGVSTLVDAMEHVKERPQEGRLSGNFSHKNYSRNRGEGDDIDSERAKLILDNASLTILAEVPEDTASVRKLRARAMALLFYGERDAAVATMERAVQMDGDPDASLLSDLAVMYLERGRDGDTAKALQHAQNAWKLEQTPETLWNLALAYERAGRDAEALSMWNAYETLDPSSPWTEEARAKIRNLAPLR